MRILTRTIYRAFPELDQYEDSRCSRFLDAAKGGRTRRWSRVAFVILCGALATSVPWGAASWILDRYVFDYSPTENHEWISNPDVIDVLRIVLGILGAIIGPVVGFLVRDFLLRRRIRFVLRTRGVCMNCKYSLVGLPVGINNAVICSECGTQSKVDAALGELTTDDAGRRLFRPADTEIAPLISWLTHSGVRAIKRWSIRSSIVLVVLVFLAAASYEGFLRWQASVAARERPGAVGYLSYIEKAQPTNGGPDAPNAWDVLEKITARISAADAECPPEPIVLSNGEPLYIYFGDVYSTNDSGDPNDRERIALSRLWSLRRLEAYKERGIFDLMEEFSQCRRAVRQFAGAPTQPIAVSIWSRSLSDNRALARIGAARMGLAQQNHDLAEYSAALRANLAIGRNLMIQGSSFDAMVASTIDLLTFERIGSVLATEPGPEWVDAIETELLSAAPRVPASYILGGTRLIDLDTISWCFEDPSHVRFGGGSKTLKPFFSPTEGRRWIGTYASNRDQYTALSHALSTISELPPHARVPSTVILPSITSALLAQLPAPDMRLLQAIDIATTQRAGILVWIALELHRIARGSYPQELSELPSTLPLDPFSGQPFVYRRSKGGRQETQGSTSESFILYSIGFNRMDDGGKTDHGSPSPDQVINWQP